MGRCPEEGVTEGIHSAPCRQETERVVPKCVTDAQDSSTLTESVCRLTDHGSTWTRTNNLLGESQ